VITNNADNPNRAQVRFLVDGAPFPADTGGYQRLVLLFDGEDPDAVSAARERWMQARADGLEATYWQPDEQGRWVKKA
jgi:DNA polymerase-3 subunit chi